MHDSAGVSEMAARASLGAAGLGLGRRVDLWSLVLAVLALIGLTWSVQQSFAWSTASLLLSVLAAALQKGLALRVAFDEAVFSAWAECWHHNAVKDGELHSVIDDLRAFDRGLAAVGLRAAEAGSLHDLDSRLRGALKLLGWQLAAFAAQFVTLLAAVLTMSLPARG